MSTGKEVKPGKPSAEELELNRLIRKKRKSLNKRIEMLVRTKKEVQTIQKELEDLKKQRKELRAKNEISNNTNN